MSNTKYDAIWVPGSFFEKGHWKLTPKTGDSGFGALIVLILVIFIACIVILISPLIISLIGFSLLKGKRYYAGIFSLLALLYLFIDYQKQWITSFIIFGTKQENFTNGILGIKYAPHFFIINSVAFGIAIYFIVSSCFINIKKSNDDLNSIDNDKNIISIAIGLLFGVLCFFFIINSHPSLTSIATETTVDLKESSPKKESPSENYEMANAPAAEETIVDSINQSTDDQIGSNTENIMADRKAEYEGGRDAYIEYIMNKVEVPEGIANQKIQVIVMLNIDAKGNVKVKKLNSRHYLDCPTCESDSEFYRLENILENNINSAIFYSPKWNPSIINGENTEAEDEIHLYFGGLTADKAW